MWELVVSHEGLCGHEGIISNNSCRLVITMVCDRAVKFLAESEEVDFWPVNPFSLKMLQIYTHLHTWISGHLWALMRFMGQRRRPDALTMGIVRRTMKN